MNTANRTKIRGCLERRLPGAETGLEDYQRSQDESRCTQSHRVQPSLRARTPGNVLDTQSDIRYVAFKLIGTKEEGAQPKPQRKHNVNKSPPSGHRFWWLLSVYMARHRLPRELSQHDARTNESNRPTEILTRVRSLVAAQIILTKLFSNTIKEFQIDLILRFHEEVSICCLVSEIARMQQRTKRPEINEPTAFQRHTISRLEKWPIFVVSVIFKNF